ncbi:ATP-binding protein [Enterococcus sp. LJL99]
MNEQVVVDEGRFGINPRLIPGILGSEIIESYGIAIAEQIKNSADAGSKSARVDLSKINEDIIVITDNGEGMTKKAILEDWLMIATENKSDEYSLSGGKGIGRFSLFKLGKELTIETFCSEGKYSFSITEDEILKSDFNDLIIPIVNRSSLNEKGTKITISKLDEQIDLNEIELDLENLIEVNNNFELEVIYPENFSTKTFLKPEEVIPYAPFKAEITINFDSIDYNFETKVDNSVIYSNGEISSNFYKKIQSLFESSKDFLKLGTINFYLYNFYFENKKPIKDYLYDNDMERRIPKLFLSAYQGINIYRNGFKIYGHGMNDWLKLAELRLSRSSENIDNKQSYGVIILDNEESNQLVEKSSREGFLKKDSSKAFSQLITLLVRQFGLDRKNSVGIIKDYVEKANSPVVIPEENVPENNHVSESEQTSIPSEKAQDDNSDRNNTGIKEDVEPVSTEESKSPVIPDSTPKSVSTEEVPRYRITRKNKLTQIEQSVFNTLPVGKIRDLICELTQIDILKYPYSTAYVFRALLENLMNEYIIANFSEIKNDFKNYSITSNNKVVFSYTKGGKVETKDVTNRKKILDFKKYLQNTVDARELKTLDSLATFIDDLNLAMHWNDKIVASSDLYAQWNNSKFFVELLCQGL